jgi:ABC-type transport system substrate-binding protein
LEFNQAIRTSSGALASVQPFQNFNLRKAIVEAWNETAFIQQDLNGLGASNPGVMLQGMLGYQSYPAYYPYNLTQSMKDIQAACAQLGCSKSNPLQITFIATNDEISELAGSLLVSTINSMQAGITLNFQPLAISAKISTFLAATFGISLYVQPNEPPDPLTMLYQFGSTFGTQGGRLGFNVTSITNMLNQAAATSDITARSALYVQIDQAIAQTASWPEVFQEQAVYATSSRIHIEPFNTVLLNVLPPVFAMSAM